MTKLIMIDPGHGGRDPGAVANGRQEKDLVLQTCLRIRNRLRQLGFRVQMTRETDTLPLPSGTIGQDLSYRAQLANRQGADLYISWHADSSQDPKSNGLGVFVHPNAGAQTNNWAFQIMEQMLAASGQSSRGVREGDFAVLRETSMPAMLVEMGFMTNASDVKRMSDPAFQQQLTEGLVRGVCQVFCVAYAQPPRGQYLDGQAVQKVLGMLGQWWQGADPEERDALHYAADKLRECSELPKEQPPASCVTLKGATKAIDKLGAAWKGTQDVLVQDVLHMAAQALRMKVGISTSG